MSRKLKFSYADTDLCRAEGCNKKCSSKNLCRTHYTRFTRHGEKGLEGRRAKGRKCAHPLYKNWARYKRESLLSDEFSSDFWSYVDVVGARPSPNHILSRPDETTRFGHANFEWKLPLRLAYDWSDPTARTEYGRLMRRINPQIESSLRKYKLTLRQYEDILVSQNGVCAICENPETTMKGSPPQLQRLSVDHDHASGKVRGLLCNNCNRVLGHAHDDIGKLEKSIRYLERHAASETGDK